MISVLCQHVWPSKREPELEPQAHNCAITILSVPQEKASAAAHTQKRRSLMMMMMMHHVPAACPPQPVKACLQGLSAFPPIALLFPPLPLVKTLFTAKEEEASQSDTTESH